MEQTIEQLIAENEVLRKTLEDHLGAELRIAAQMRVLLKELSTFGPAATANVLTWVFAPFMRTSGTFYEYQFFDRRPPKPTPVVEPPVLSVPLIKKRRCPHCGSGPFTAQGLGGHVWKKHGIRISEAE